MSEQAKFNEINQVFDKQFSSFNDKCCLMRQNLDKGNQCYGSFLENLTKIKGEIEDYQQYYEKEGNKFYKEHKNVEFQLKQAIDFVTNSESYLNIAKEDLDKKSKHIEIAKASMRTIMGNLDSKKLRELKVHENSSLLNLFQTLYSILYKAGKDEFNWANFKKNILIKDKSDDFISKASNLDPLEVPKAKIDTLNSINQDEWLKKFVSENPKGGIVLDIMDYLEYIPECAKTIIEINELEQNTKKIKKELIMSKYKVEILRKKLKILDDNYSQLTKLHMKIMENKPDVLKLMGKVDEKLEELNLNSNKMIQEIHDIYDKDIQKVPNSLYE